MTRTITRHRFRCTAGAIGIGALVLAAAAGWSSSSTTTAANGARALRVRAPADQGAGPSALLMIRPTGVGLVSGPGDEHHLTGVVADVGFRGRGYEHAVDLPGSGRLTGVFAQTRAARGEPVGLRLESGGCHVFPG